MTAPDDVRACPFCGNAKMEIHHNTQAGITFLLCGDDRGRGGCGAVVSFRPNLTGSKALQAYNRRAAHADMAGEVRELAEEVIEAINDGDAQSARNAAQATLDKFAHQEKDRD